MSNEALLSHIAPVREIFDLNELDFDEIMQRDIDDARVASELIPYLLDEQSVDLVKLFPPIVVIVLPIKEEDNTPAKLYPEVTEEIIEEKKDIGEAGQYILRSGSIGREVFQLEQPISDGERLKHDLVRLRLNTNKTRLVIVDGQHRAMALLALYRNLKDQWSDEKRAPFKQYYSQWTNKYIQKFNLKEINLPVILCTFPSLNTEYNGELIIAFLEKFAMYDKHNQAVLKLKQEISSYSDRQVEAILFQGQGISRVFKAHIASLKNKIKEGEFANIPEIESIIENLSATENRVQNALGEAAPSVTAYFEQNRAELCIEQVTDKSKLKNPETKQIINELVAWFNSFYHNVLTTVAFQTALVCTFFEATEVVINKIHDADIKINTKELSNNYVEQLNSFFTPKTCSELKKLIKVFNGEIEGEILHWKIKSVNYTFREIVYRGEMNPAHWTKYKYLILEIWHPENEFLRDVVNEEREKCRKQIFPELYKLNKFQYCKIKSKLEENLTQEEKTNIFMETFDSYNQFLSNIYSLLGMEKNLLDKKQVLESCSGISSFEI